MGQVSWQAKEGMIAAKRKKLKKMAWSWGSFRRVKKRFSAGNASMSSE